MANKENHPKWPWFRLVESYNEFIYIYICIFRWFCMHMEYIAFRTLDPNFTFFSEDSWASFFPSRCSGVVSSIGAVDTNISYQLTFMFPLVLLPVHAVYMFLRLYKYILLLLSFIIIIIYYYYYYYCPIHIYIIYHVCIYIYTYILYICIYIFIHVAT